MARGWESKGVEEQIREREAESERAAKKPVTPEHAALRTRREGLQMARARALEELRSTRHQRRRDLIERTIQHLDAQLAQLDAPAEE
jgi:hypothetical protein